MRILHVIQELRTGGAERVVASLVRGATERGHEVAVAAAPGAVADELGLRPFPLPLLERRPWRVPLGAWRVLHAIREFRPDVVHAQNPAMALLVALATLRGRRPAALVSVHGVPESDYRATARLLRAAGLPVVACGPGVESGLTEAGFSCVGTITNAVPPPPKPRDRPELERELGIRSGTRLVVAVGRLVPVKNHALAIQAIASVPDATLAIVGEGPLHEQLAGQAASLGVADRVVLTGLRADARAIMGAADAVVVPSVGEGLPLVALEALAARAPVVATSVRGIRELLTDERNSLLVPAGDADALAAALRRVLEDDALAARLAQAGAELVAPYTETRMVESYLSLYERLVAQ
ncbi:MAG TPA: glycosyltransferase [Gaiellaceae bacterium]|nr:glycosyltransferase [Gaiellaceae bacterium]